MNEKTKASNQNDIMILCAKKAAERSGFTKTNPLVGAAVVKEGNILSIGVHEVYGGGHAEVNALERAGEKALGADLYVTLEPCSTYGKTPPCTEKIIASGIKNVYVGVPDPNPLHCGNGIRELRNAGINVYTGIASDVCASLIEDFIKSKIFGIPYVRIKIAMSADGRIAAHSGDSKWITSSESRKTVHKLRSSCGAVISGIGTVLADDPKFTDRRGNALRQPSRVILDSFARLPLSSELIKSVDIAPLIIYVSEFAAKEDIERLRHEGAEVYIAPINAGELDINFILKSLYEKNIMNVMVEAGSSLAGSFRDLDAIDYADIFIAPKFIGGSGALSPFGGKGVNKISESENFKSMDISFSGEDIHIKAKLHDYTDKALSLLNEL